MKHFSSFSLWNRVYWEGLGSWKQKRKVAPSSAETKELWNCKNLTTGNDSVCTQLHTLSDKLLQMNPDTKPAQLCSKACWSILQQAESRAGRQAAPKQSVIALFAILSATLPYLQFKAIRIPSSVTPKLQHHIPQRRSTAGLQHPPLHN